MESSADPVLQRKGFLDRFRKKTPQPSESTPLLSRRNRTETYVAEAYVAPHPEAVENKPAKTCDLIVSRINPQSPLKQFTEKDPKTQLELILKHTTSDTLLIRFGDSLFFYDKETQHSKTIVIAEKDLSLFDLEFKLSASLPEHSAQLLTQSFTQPRRLSTKEQFRLNSLFDIGPNQIRLLSQLAIERPNKSEWRERKGVDLMVINKDPRDVALESLPFTNAAYLRYNNELWYVRKHLNWFQKQLEKIGLLKQRRLLKKVQGRALERFDQGMELYSKPYQHLSDRKIELAGLLTGHTHRTAWQQFLHYFANFCVGFMAIGCGISTAATFISLNLMTGGAATAIAAIFFLTGAAVNWWIFKRYVSPVLINLFGREKFFVNEKGETLSLTKKAAMIIALIFSLSVGITYAGLTYVSTIALPATFSFLGAISIALPPVAGLLAAVAFFCMTALMLKDIADLIKKVDVWGEIVKFCKNMVDTDPNLDQNKVNGEPKSRPRIIAERFLTTFFTAVFIPVACLGLYMTMNACVPGVKAILLNVIPSAAEMTASIVSLGFAFIGQIPFGIATAIETICKCVPGFFQNVSDFYHYAADKIHGKKREPKKIDPATVIQKGETAPKPDSLLVAEIKEGCVVGNASGNGVISLAGATSTNSTFWVIIAFISGFFNSFSAGKPAVSNRPKVPSVLPDSGVMKALGGSPDISDAKDVVPKTVSRDNEMFIKGQQSAAAIQGRMLPIPLQLQKEIRSNTYDSKASYRNMKENLQPPSESPMAEDKSTEDNAEAKSTKDKLVFRSQPIALGARALLNAPFESPTSTLESSSALFSKLNAHAVELKKKRIKKTCDDMAMDYNKDFSKQRIIAGAA